MLEGAGGAEPDQGQALRLGSIQERGHGTVRFDFGFVFYGKLGKPIEIKAFRARHFVRLGRHPDLSGRNGQTGNGPTKKCPTT